MIARAEWRGYGVAESEVCNAWSRHEMVLNWMRPGARRRVFVGGVFEAVQLREVVLGGAADRAELEPDFPEIGARPLLVGSRGRGGPGHVRESGVGDGLVVRP